MSHNPDSENISRLWSDRPQPSGDAIIIHCLSCFTPLMNLHDFVPEPVNPVHSFHDAHTVPFCLTADHFAMCHMSLCPHQASTVLVCLWTCVVWRVFGTCDDGWRSLVASMEYHGDSEWRSLAASMESHGDMWWKRSSIHGVPWRQRVEKSGSIAWSPMEKSGGNGAASMEYHGQRVETWQPPWSPMVSSVLDTGSDGRSRQLVLECPGLSIK